MKNWLRWFIWLLEIGVVLIVIYGEPTHGVRGKLYGEAFFQDRPTSYWRGVVERDLQMDPIAIWMSPAYVPPTLWQRVKDWCHLESRVDSSQQLFDRPDAADVLTVLANDSTPQIAGFARDALGTNPQFADLFGDIRLRGISRGYVLWMESIRKHNLKHPPAARAN